MCANESCPRCRHRLRPLPQPRCGAAPLTGARLAAFVVWPGAGVLLLAGYVPAFVVLALLGLTPSQAAIVLLVAALATGVLGAILWAVAGRLSSPDRDDRREAHGRFCPACETTFPIR